MRGVVCLHNLFNVSINNRQRGVLGYEAHIGKECISNPVDRSANGRPGQCNKGPTRVGHELVGRTNLCPELQGSVNHALSKGSLST